MLLIDPQGFIVIAANPAADRLFGIPPELLIGRPFTDFVNHPDLGKVANDFQTALSNEKSLHFEQRLVRQDGTFLVVDACIDPFCPEGEQFSLLAILRDVTDRPQAEASLLQSRDQLSAQLQVFQNLVSTLDIDSLVNQILDHLATIIDYDVAAILETHDNRIAYLGYRGFGKPEPDPFLMFQTSANPVLQQFLSSKEMIYVEDARAPDVSFERFGSQIGAWRESLEVYRTWLVLPLIAQGKRIGSVVLAHTQANHFNLSSREAANAFASQAATAVENAYQFRAAKEKAIEVERNRLARNLHDLLIQTLYAVTLHGDATKLAISAGEYDAAYQNLNELQANIDEAMTDVRMLIYELRPQILQQVGLAAAIKNRLEAVEARAGLHPDFQVTGDSALPPDTETELFLVAQEALTNVVKHAHATRVQVALRFDGNGTNLTVADNGQGFCTQEAESGKGMGLKNMRERIQHIGGSMTLETSPGNGTALQFKLQNHSFRPPSDL